MNLMEWRRATDDVKSSRRVTMTRGRRMKIDNKNQFNDQKLTFKFQHSLLILSFNFD